MKKYITAMIACVFLAPFFSLHTKQSNNVWGDYTLDKEEISDKYNHDEYEELLGNIPSEENEIRIYVIYSHSHKHLFDKWFWPTLEDEYEVVVRHAKQQCQNGAYKEQGWCSTMLRKVEIILQAIEENRDHPFFIYADVDIQFFRPTYPVISQKMLTNDIAIQKNSPTGEICAGFFACRANDKTKALFEAVRDEMIKRRATEDQTPLDMFLRKKNTFGVTWTYLPDTFMNGWTFRQSSWIPFMKPKIPQGIILHHANWCKGLDEKTKQLEYVRTRMNAKPRSEEMTPQNTHKKKPRYADA